MTPSQFIEKIDKALAEASTATNNGFNATLTRAISAELIAPETHAILKRHFETITLLQHRMVETSIGRANQICDTEHQAALEKFSREMSQSEFAEWIKNARSKSWEAKLSLQEKFRPMNQRIRAEIDTLECENTEAAKAAITQVLPALKAMRDAWTVEETRKASLLGLPYAPTVSVAGLSAQIEKLERALAEHPRNFSWGNLQDFWASICVKPAPSPSPAPVKPEAAPVDDGQLKAASEVANTPAPRGVSKRV